MVNNATLVNMATQLGHIKTLMMDIGITPLSLASKDYTMIWYDKDADCVFVKWADLYGNDGVKKLTDLFPHEVEMIYDDLKIDFE